MIDWWKQASGEQGRHTTSLKIFESSNLQDESNNECHHFTKYHPIQRILLLHCEQMRWQFSHYKTSIWKCTCQAKHAGNAPKKFGIFRTGNKVSFAIPSYFRHLVTQFCRQFRILALFLMLQKQIYNLWQTLVQLHNDLRNCLTHQVKNWPRLFCYNIKNTIQMSLTCTAEFRKQLFSPGLLIKPLL